MRLWPTRRRWRAIFAGVIVLGFAGALVTYNRFFREADPPVFQSDEDHFLFGSIGTEGNEGVPYWIWLVLPRIFPDLLPTPGGYASLGLVSRGNAEMPVGLSKVTVGFPRVGINCAFCHTASYRLRPDDPPVLVPGGPSHQTAPQAYFRFLFTAASDPRFNASTILGEIAKNYRLPLVDRLLMRFAIIPGTRRALRRARDEQDVWMRKRPDWGAGRIDPFNPVKFRMLEPAGGRHHRQQRHGAGVEHPPARGLGLSLGRPEPVAARSGGLVRARRRCVERLGGSRRREVGRRRPGTHVEHAAHRELHAVQRGTAVPAAG